MKSVRDILLSRESDGFGRFVSREFQHYGYALAQELDDLPRKALYIKLAKHTDRRLMEEARLYVKDYPRARRKAGLFMWKLTQLKKDRQS